MAEERDKSHLRQLLALAVPTFGQLVAEPAFVMIDTAIVGHVSDSALAGLSLGSTIVLTAVGLCVFLAYSTTSQVAHLFGAGRRREGLQCGVDGLWLAAVIGVVLACVLFLAADALCWVLGGRGADAALGAVYVRTVAVGVPGMLMVYAANGIFRGLQKVSVTLVAAVSGAVLNTVLDVLFVMGLGWGIAGSGVATCIAQWFMAVFLLVPALRWAMVGGVRLKPRLASIASAGGEGFPLFLRTLALRAGLVATVMAAASMGTDVLAGYQVVNATWNFAANVLDSVAIAGQAMVGAELGAKRFDRARSLSRDVSRFGLVSGVIVGAAFAFSGFASSGLFSPNPHIQHLAATGMVVVGVGLPLQGWMWALDGILIGAGDFRYLARACAAASAVHIAVLLVVVLALSPILPNDFVRTAVLWAAFDVALMGGRAVGNGLRIRQNAWMN